MSALDIFEGYELSAGDKSVLGKLHIPIPEDEAKRLEILRQTTLVDSSQSDDGFDRISALSSRLFSVYSFKLSYLTYFDRISTDALRGDHIRRCGSNMV